MHDMHAMKARVENGRLKLDEPTDLPEGKLVDVVLLDEVFLNGGDDLDDEERAALHESIREGIADMEADRTVDAKTAIAELRSRL
jgi:predicted DNA-binding antitoxin AbrB/MazE fold protein